MKRCRNHGFILLLMALALVSAPGAAFADCTSPAGVESQTQYDFTGHVLKYCDGTNWLSMGGGSSSGSDGYIQFSNGSGGFASDTGLVWDNTNKRLGINVAAPNSDLSFGGGANRMISMTSRSGTGDGFSLTIRSGATANAVTDKNGGSLILSSGVGTGTGSSAIYFRTATPQASTNTTDNTPTDKMTILGNGNVGIGTTTPGALLSFGSGATEKIRLYDSGSVVSSFGFGIAANDLRTYLGTTSDYFTWRQGGYNGTELMRLTGAGNVGIGTTSPSYLLSLGGNASRTIGMERTTATNGYNLTIRAGGAVSGGTDLNGGNLILASGTATGTGSSNIYFQTAAAGATGTADRAAGTAMTILGSNDVGIGSTAPDARLRVSKSSTAGHTTFTTYSDVYDATGDYVANFMEAVDGVGHTTAHSMTGLKIRTFPSGSGYSNVKEIGLHISMRQNDYAAIFETGRVGIYTTTPTYALSFGGEAARVIGVERPTTATNGLGLTINAGGAQSGGTDLNGGNLTLVAGTSTGSGSSNIHFQTATAGATATTDRTPTSKMTILGNGNVGIGTTTPAAKLDVNGFMRLAKNASAPATCDATIDGSIALTSQYTLCACKGGSSAWVTTSDGTTACTW